MRGWKRNACDFFARLNPNGVFAREYFRYGEILIPARERKLERFIRNDLLNLLMLRVIQVYLREDDE